MTAALLYPCDPLAPRRVDAHFRAEAAEARALGADVALLDHDALLRGDVAEAVRRIPAGAGGAGAGNLPAMAGQRSARAAPVPFSVAGGR
ncbi:hypothetical protein DEF24_27305, partial [Marinitenerispora sediminis]